MGEYISEKLRIFVSSTIKECTAERAVTKRAIESLNHEAILFEHLGARSVPPRELYLRKLDESHIFIGVYRESYGWIGPESTISGIEEEFRRSRQRGMPRLIYICEEDQKRDPRLVAMLHDLESEAEITFAKFRVADELYQRIREDVEAEIAKRFYEADKLEAIVHTDAATAVSGLVPAPKSVLLREQLGSRLLEQLATHHVLQVTGELGIGKTVFLASLATQNNFIFVSGTQLGNHELSSVIANKLAALAGRETRYFTDASSAYSALQESWRAVDTFTLVIDDCQRPDFIAAVLKNSGGVSSAKRLIYSMRNPDPSYGHEVFPIPPLSITEVTEFLKTRGLTFSGKELDVIYKKSGGNPLYLLYFSEAPEGNIKTLTEYELAAWRTLAPLAQELATYLAVANQRLFLADLLTLAGPRGGGVEAVSGALQSAQVFVTEFPSGYFLRHEHQRATILSQLTKAPNKCAYYNGRVGRLLKKRGDYLRAYFVFRPTDPAAAAQISRPALFDAQRRHDFRSQLEIIDDILESKRPSEAHDLMILLVSKIQALHYTGTSAKVPAVLAEVETIAANSEDVDLKLRAREARITFSAVSTMAPEILEELQRLEQEYFKVGDRWSAGRLTSELSVLFTAAKKYSESLAASERGLKIFEELKDDYGISISLRNMAVALSETPGREKDAAELIERLRKQQEKTGTERERAWLCNYMVRTLRRKKQLTEALQYGQEAVRIGEALGDLQLVANNKVNVGNVYRDMHKWEEALAEYASGGEIARKYGDKNLESSAARLTATIYRRQGNNRVALEHALLAVSFVQGTLASTALADALEEAGDCYTNMREWAQAAEFYAKAAAATEDIEEQSRLTAESLATCVYRELDSRQYLECLNIALRSSTPAREPVTQQLFSRIPDLLKIAHSDHAIHLFGLHFRTLFEELPKPVARFLFERVLNELLVQTASNDVWRSVFPIIPLISSISSAELTLRELTEVGDRVHERLRGFHFKPQKDGALWVLALNLQQPVIVTITCLDGRTDTFTAAALLSLFLKGFEENIAEILDVPEIPRREMDIHLGSIESVPSDLRKHFPATFDTCVVSRAAFRDDEHVPTFVVCREDLSARLRAGTGTGDAVQILFAKVLTEVIFQLLNGDIDVEVLAPKVMEVVRKTLS